MSNVAFAIPLSTIEEAKEEQAQKESEQLADEEEEDESVVFWPPTSSTLPFRLFLLTLAALIPFGGHAVKYELGPLGPLLLGDPNLQLSHAEFGALQSAISIPNLFFPIIGGLWLDYRGSKTATLCCLLLTLFSHVCFIFSLLTHSFASAFFFHILFGAGQGGSVVSQARIASRYFLGHELVMAIAVSEASHNLAIFLANITTLPIAETFGSYLYSLWFGAGYCLLSLIIGVILFWLVRHELDSGKDSDEHVQKLLEAIPTIRRASGTGSVSTKGRRQSSIISVPSVSNRREWTVLGSQFILIALIHLLYGNCSHLFGYVLTNMMFSDWHFGLTSSALMSSLAAGSSVLLCPILGWYLDRSGKKIYLVSCACVFSALAYSALALCDPQSGNSSIVAIGALFVLAISSSFVPTVLRASVAHVVPSALLGTAFGLYQMFEALGSVLGHYTVGYFRDTTHSYKTDLWIFAGLSLLGCSLALLLSYVDARRGGLLNAPSIEKDADAEAEDEKAKALAELEEAEEREKKAKEEAARNSRLYSLARERAAAIFAKHAAAGNGANAEKEEEEKDEDLERSENAPLLLRVDAVPSAGTGYGAMSISPSSKNALSPAGHVPSTLSGGGSARSSLSLPHQEHAHERSTSWTLEIANQKPKLYPRRRRSWMKSQTIPYLAVKRKPSVSPNPSPTVAINTAAIKETQK